MIVVLLVNHLFKRPQLGFRIWTFNDSFLSSNFRALKKKNTKYTNRIFFSIRCYMELYIFLNLHIPFLCQSTTMATTQLSPLILDHISEYRAWQALQVYFTVLLNRQLCRRLHLEQKAMQHLPISRRFRTVLLLEPVPTLSKPPTVITTKTQNSLLSLKSKVRLLRARVEKGKELVFEIERRMQNISIVFPTHFCYTCVVDSESGSVEVLLTKCGHRVCTTCIAFGIDQKGAYECSICFRPAHFVVKGKKRVMLETRV
jgi:hypothetical protein